MEPYQKDRSRRALRLPAGPEPTSEREIPNFYFARGEKDPSSDAPPRQKQFCSYGDGTGEGVEDYGDNVLEYHKVGPITLHGAKAGHVVWSSSHFPSQINQQIFRSEDRFNLRVVVREPPKKGTFDSNGSKCSLHPVAYQSLQIGVILRTHEGSPGRGEYHFFEEIPVGCASRVHQFSVPRSSYPLVVEIKNVEWDWSCEYYSQQGYNTENFCPFAPVWANDCVQIELQFSTDGTKDLPRN